MVFVSYFYGIFLNFLTIFQLKKSFGNSLVTSGYMLGLHNTYVEVNLKQFFSANSGILIGDLEGFKNFLAVMPLYEMNY